MASAERRQNPRYPVSAAVSFYHEPSRREFPARSADISQGGMLIYTPIATPLKVGQALRLTVSEVERPELAPLAEAPLQGHVARIDRAHLLEEGYLAVGVQFTGR